MLPLCYAQLTLIVIICQDYTNFIGLRWTMCPTFWKTQIIRGTTGHLAFCYSGCMASNSCALTAATTLWIFFSSTRDGHHSHRLLHHHLPHSGAGHHLPAQALQRARKGQRQIQVRRRLLNFVFGLELMTSRTTKSQLVQVPKDSEGKATADTMSQNSPSLSNFALNNLKLSLTDFLQTGQRISLAKYQPKT